MQIYWYSFEKYYTLCGHRFLGIKRDYKNWIYENHTKSLTIYPHPSTKIDKEVIIPIIFIASYKKDKV